MSFSVSLSQYENYSEAAINFAYFCAILSMLYRNMKSVDNCDKILPFSYRNSPWIVYCDNRLARQHDFDYFLSQKSPISRIAIKRTTAAQLRLQGQQKAQAQTCACIFLFYLCHIHQLISGLNHLA
jgi:hypothetical protein